MKKISFPEPACRFNCPHFKIVGAMLNETCYCMKKRQERQAIPEKGYQAQTPGLVSAAAEDLRVPDLWLSGCTPGKSGP